MRRGRYDCYYPWLRCKGTLHKKSFTIFPAGRGQRATGSLSFTRQLAERSSPSRVRCAAQNQRALDCSGPFYRLTFMKEREPMINASTTRVPPVGRGCAILGGGIFDRNYGEFSTGVDNSH
jgi:hypothetical protein